MSTTVGEEEDVSVPYSKRKDCKVYLWDNLHYQNKDQKSILVISYCSHPVFLSSLV